MKEEAFVKWTNMIGGLVTWLMVMSMFLYVLGKYLIIW